MSLFKPESREGYRVMRYLERTGMIVEYRPKAVSNNLVDLFIGYLIGKLEGFIAARVEMAMNFLVRRCRLWGEHKQLELWEQ